jgi:hypothetical protein
MPKAVYANTPALGVDFYVEEGVKLSHTVPTIVDELTPAMEYQLANLRVVEIDEDGEPIPQPPRPADGADDPRLSMVEKERDTLASHLSDATQEAQDLKAKHEALEASHAAQIALLEGLLPTKKTALSLLSPEQLKDLAEYRGVAVEGDKAAFVEALTKGD